MPHTGTRIFKTEARGYAVVKLVFDRHVILGGDAVYTVCGIRRVEWEVGIGTLADAETYLRAGLEEELEALFLTSPTKMGEYRHLDVIHRSAVLFRQTRCWVDYGSVLLVENVLFPSYLGIVDLGLHGAYRVKIFLTDIAEGDAASDAAVERLVYLWGETYVAKHIAAVDANAQVVAIFADLCLGRGRKNE